MVSIKYPKNIINKSYILFTILVIGFLLWNCEKFFHPEEDNISSIGNYNELLSAVYGTYGLFQECLNEQVLNRANIKGDDINFGSPLYETDSRFGRCWYNIFISEAHYDWVIWHNGSTGAWTSLYRIIASINNILTQYNINNLSDSSIKTVLGEMYLLRAYCYFRLVRTYGEIPIINDVDVNYAITKSSYTEIYQFIESDLKKAMTLLPVYSNNARRPNISPHRGSAKAILAEVYLSWAGYPAKDASKYSLAAQTAKEVIDSANIFGFGLLDDFSSVWDKTHLYNTESVYSIYFQDPNIYNGCKFAIWDNTIQNFPYSGIVATYNYSFRIAPSISVTLDFYPAEFKFYKNFPCGYRKEITFYTNIWEKNCRYNWDHETHISTLISCDSANFRFDSTDICARTAYRKFYYDPYLIEYNTYFSPYDSADNVQEETSFTGIPRVYLYRFTNTLLTYAEASARSGKISADAYEYVNQIRRRARHLNINSPSSYDLSAGLSAETFADSVVWERAWEHAGELEGRWFDLVRLEKVEELPKLRDPYEGGPPGYPITKGCYFSPIPESDKILNPNLN